MEAVHSSEILVKSYQTIWCHFPGDSENLGSNTVLTVYDSLQFWTSPLHDAIKYLTPQQPEHHTMLKIQFGMLNLVRVFGAGIYRRSCRLYLRVSHFRNYYTILADTLYCESTLTPMLLIGPVGL
jgi:hypothetical protein